jgi:nucleoside-diphosphate-sugar epimerase
VRIAPGVVRDFIFIPDLVKATLLASRACLSGKIINIGSGTGVTLEQMAIKIKSLSGSSSPIVLDHIYTRKKDSACWADISQAHKLIGWSPKHSLDQGLATTISWYQNNIKKIPSEVLSRLKL